jgi:hypothetical protein
MQVNLSQDRGHYILSQEMNKEWTVNVKVQHRCELAGGDEFSIQVYNRIGELYEVRTQAEWDAIRSHYESNGELMPDTFLTLQIANNFTECRIKEHADELIARWNALQFIAHFAWNI